MISLMNCPLAIQSEYCFLQDEKQYYYFFIITYTYCKLMERDSPEWGIRKEEVSD